ncbi:hypothetical protein HG531_011544 [Fusarium graminearum]|nr:hypothetical protein HG531_011544 [Fusarium graminearum]
MLVIIGSVTVGRRVTYRVGSWGLWPTGLSRHDDLVNGQDCASGLGGKLNSPLLGDEKIEDSLVLSIKKTSVVIVLIPVLARSSWVMTWIQTNLNIDTSVPSVTVGMGSVQSAQDFSSIKTSAFCDSARHDLESLTELLDGILAETRGLLTVSLYSLNKLNFCGTSTRDQSGVAGNGLDNIDTIVDGTLNIVKVVLGSTSENQGGCSGDLILLTEDCDAVTTNLESLDNRGGTDDTADSSKLELAEDSDAQNAKAVKVVHGQITDSLSADNDTEARVVELLDGGLELRLLALCEIHHLLGVVQKNSSLGLSLSSIDRANHALHNLALLQASTHDLDDTDVVDVEVSGVLGEYGEDGLSNKIGKESLVSVLLAGNDDSSSRVSRANFCAFSFSKQLAGEDDNKVGGITHLGFLLLTGHDKELGGGMNDFEFSEDGSSVGGKNHLLQMVDNDLVAAIGAERGLDGGRNCPAGVDVAEDGTIFRVVAVGRKR